MFEIPDGCKSVLECAPDGRFEFFQSGAGGRTVEFNVLNRLTHLGTTGGKNLEDPAVGSAAGADDRMQDPFDVESLLLDRVGAESIRNGRSSATISTTAPGRAYPHSFAVGLKTRTAIVSFPLWSTNSKRRVICAAISAGGSAVDHSSGKRRR